MPENRGIFDPARREMAEAKPKRRRGMDRLNKSNCFFAKTVKSNCFA